MCLGRPANGPDELALPRYYSQLGGQDRTGFAEGHVDCRQEQMYGSVSSVLTATAM